jgi:hypothetical protein
MRRVEATSSGITRRATVSLVLVLLASRGPSTVLRAVGSIAVNAVEAVLRRRLPSHVGKEVLEREPPAIGNDYASSSVLGVRDSLRVVAPLLHRKPRRVFGARSVLLSFNNAVLAVADVLSDLWVAVAIPPPVMHLAPATSIKQRSVAPINRAFVVRYSGVIHAPIVPEEYAS